jgi:hypothetical protein
MLGQFDWDNISNSSRTQAISVLKSIFESDPDVSVHSASQWALRRHGQSAWLDETINQQANLDPDPRKDWYVNGQGQTMAIFDARDVPGIGYVFEIATAEVTVEQMKRFRPDHTHYEYRSPTPDCPVGMTDWYLAVAYCRWLTDDLNADPDHAYPDGLTIDSPSQDVDDVLKHGAYRLPTSNEWEYVCAAQTKSQRYFGMNDSLIGEYFWHWEISVVAEIQRSRYFPADSMKPNDFGLFAMYDGVREWCHNQHLGPKWRAVAGKQGGLDPTMGKTAEMVVGDLPNALSGYYGLRVARTVAGR